MTVFQVMRRPRWIATLVLALVIAAGFAALGQWQLGRAVTNGAVLNTGSETMRPLQDVATPQKPVLEAQAAQRAETTGHWVGSGYDVLGGRLNDGTSGYWVIGQFAVDQPADTYLAVALGWTTDLDLARTTAQALSGAAGASAGQPDDGTAGVTSSAVPPSVTLQGRYLPTEGPVATDQQKPVPGESLDGTPLQTTMSVASLVNRWTQFDADADVYGGYLVLDTPPAPLGAIASPEPDRSVQLNWLNIFYAAEWVVFAGFAIYFWYRLVRDAWERETEDGEEVSADNAPDARVG